MKKILVLTMLLVAAGLAVPRSWAMFDPSDKLFEVYGLIQEGDRAEQRSDFPAAAVKFRAAISTLNDIKHETPGWNPTVIEFRMRSCLERLRALRVRQTGGTAAPPTTTAARPAAAPVAPAAKPVAPAPTVVAAATAAADRAANERVEQLTTELKLARDRIKQLESSRTDLSKQLQDALHTGAAPKANEHVEELLKKNTDLTAKLAIAQSALVKLREEYVPKSTETTAATAETIQLRATLTEVRAELASTKRELSQTKDELISTKQQLNIVQAENKTLKQTQVELSAKLTEADRQLRASRVANDKSNEIIVQLRQENAILRTGVAAESKTATAHPKDDDATGPSELIGWHHRRVPPPAPKPELKPPAIESGRDKLVASLNAPAKPGATQPAISGKLATTPPQLPPAPVSQPEPVPTVETQMLLTEAGSALAAKDYNLAGAKYETVLAREPGNMVALANLAVLRYQQGRLDESETVLHKATSTEPNDSASRSLLGVIYFRKGKIEEAFGELTRAVALNPQNAEAHNYLGITLNEKGWATSAEQEVRRAIEINPKYADAHFNLAVLYARGRSPRYELARYHYQKAVELGADKDAQLEKLLKTSSAPTRSATATSSPTAEK